LKNRLNICLDPPKLFNFPVGYKKKKKKHKKQRLEKLSKKKKKEEEEEEDINSHKAPTHTKSCIDQNHDKGRK